MVGRVNPSRHGICLTLHITLKSFVSAQFSRPVLPILHESDHQIISDDGSANGICVWGWEGRRRILVGASAKILLLLLLAARPPK